MISRAEAIDHLQSAMSERDFVVSSLGYLSRELYARSAAFRERCFYCMGSMGSVVPISLGISLARPSVRVLALEGDGSLLMNLGSLATLRRYGSARVRLLLFDNRCYESTGGQPSQADGLEIERICEGVGLNTSVATEGRHVRDFLDQSDSNVLVIKVATGGKASRISDSPQHIAQRFAGALTRIEVDTKTSAAATL